EIEKAHPDVHNILLQVFDEGRLTDGKGRTVDFTNTIIIATSNLGSEIIQRNLTLPEEYKRSYDALKEELMVVLRRNFRPEFLNRIDEIIVFHALTQEQIREIVKLQLQKVSQMLSEQGVIAQWDDSLIEHLAEVGYQPEFGARELKRKIRSEVETELSSALLQGTLRAGDTVKVRYDTETRKVVIEKVPVEVKS
ncbi:MAG: AAA family ATPase, partial [Candidatus Caldarchaeum sp.]